MMSFKKPVVIINTASGSSSDIREEISEIFQKDYGVSPRCYLIQSQDLDETLKTALSSGCDLLITYGGDGTALAAANRAQDFMVNDVAVPVVPLPGGTMNVLPKALYGTEDWETALRLALSQSQPCWRPVGVINDCIFIVAAMIGTIVRMGVTRELVREGDIIAASKNLTETIKESLQEVRQDNAENRSAAHFDYILNHDGRRVIQSANLLLFTCPNMNEFSIQPEAFEAVGVDVHSFSDLSSLGLSAFFNKWREDEATHLAFTDRAKVLGDGEIDVLLDGEHRMMQFPLTIALKQKGALFLCPPL